MKGVAAPRPEAVQTHAGLEATRGLEDFCHIRMKSLHYGKLIM